MSLKIKIALLPGARLPERQTKGAAAYDVAACLPPDSSLTINPGDRVAVPTGLIVEIPPGYYISIRPRSGLALKHGLALLNAPGTVDSDYRGEIKVIIHNAGREPFVLEHGDRIAQMLLEKETGFSFEQVSPSDLGATERSGGGFGSTGLA